MHHQQNLSCTGAARPLPVPLVHSPSNAPWSSAQEGGAFYVMTNSKLKVIDTTADSCHAARLGGVVALADSSSSATLEASSLINCSAPVGAALALAAGAQLQVTVLDIAMPCAAVQSGGLISRTGSSGEAVSSFRGITITPLGCPTGMPAPQARLLLSGLSLPTCANASIYDVTLGRELPICAATATCVDAPRSGTSMAPTIPIGASCECLAPSYPATSHPAASAPYQSDKGCVTPVIAETISLTRNEVTLVLQKSVTTVEQRLLTLSIGLNGTDDTIRAHSWRVAERETLPQWLHVPQQSGNISLSRQVMIPLSVSGVGLLDNSLNEYTLLLSTDTHTSVQLSMRIRVFVRSAAVAATSTVALPAATATAATATAITSLALPSSAKHVMATAEFGRKFSFTLTARDVQGLTLDHGGDLFRVDVRSSTSPGWSSGAVQYESDGNYTVHVTPSLLGYYQVVLKLEQATSCCRMLDDAACCEAARSGAALAWQPLPITVILHATCPEGKVPLPGDQTKCGCGPGMQMTSDGLCTPCEIGAYKSHAGDTLCQPCGGRHKTTAAIGADEEAKCVCAPSYFLISGDAECQRCAEGASCSTAGTTLETLNVQPSHWRLTNRSTQILLCALDDASSPMNDTTPSPSSCLGGVNLSEQCSGGTQGPFCRVCASSGMYFDVEEQSCVRCPAGLDALSISKIASSTSHTISLARLCSSFAPYGVFVCLRVCAGLLCSQLQRHSLLWSSLRVLISPPSYLRTGERRARLFRVSRPACLPVARHGANRQEANRHGVNQHEANRQEMNLTLGTARSPRLRPIQRSPASGPSSRWLVARGSRSPTPR